MLAERELGFADACIAACQADPLDDACRQQEYAAAYKLWVLWLVSESLRCLGFLFFVLCCGCRSHSLYSLS